MTQYSGGFSSRSAVEMGTQRRMSTGVPLVAPVQRPYNFHDDTLVGSSSYHTSGHSHQQQQQSRMSTRSTATAEQLQLQQQQQQEGMTLPGIPTLQRQPSPVPSWVGREGLTSERYVYYGSGGGGSGGGGGGGVGTLPNPAPMRRTLSGTLAKGGGVGGWREPEVIQPYSFKGPAQRTLSRFSNYRHHHHHQQQQQQQFQQQQQHMGRGTLQYQQVATGSGSVHGQSTVRRTGSLHSLRSVGKGGDVLDGDGCGGSDTLGG